MSVSQQPATGDGATGDRPDFPLSDAPLLDLLDAVVNDLGRVAAAEALGGELPHHDGLLRFPACVPADAQGAGGVPGRGCGYGSRRDRG